MRSGSISILMFMVLLLLQMAVPAVAEAKRNLDLRSCLLVQGQSSYYGKNFRKEKLNTHAANGKRFNPNAMTAASPTLPFGTKVKVTDRETGRAIVVTITDRGPALWTGRVLDLSYGAAKRLGMVQRGVTSVRIERASGACSHLADNVEGAESVPSQDTAEQLQLAMHRMRTT